MPVGCARLDPKRQTHPRDLMGDSPHTFLFQYLTLSYFFFYRHDDEVLMCCQFGYFGHVITIHSCYS